MSLIVETGAGLPNAESYISVADATAYHAARGNTAWAALADDTTREQLLRKATDFMEQNYRSRWAGYMLTLTQALAWPRFEVPVKGYAVTGLGAASGFGAYYPSNVVPAQVANACAELALRAATADLSPDKGPQKQSFKVGPISTTYVAGTRQNTMFTAIEGILADFLSFGNSTVQVVRA